MWLEHRKHKEVLNSLSSCLTAEVNPESFVLSGPYCTGKSSVIEKLHQRHKVKDLSKGIPERPIVSIYAPPIPSELRVLNHILDVLGISVNEKAPSGQKLLNVSRVLKELKVKLLTIDDFDSISAGSHKQQLGQFNSLRYLQKNSGVSICLIGNGETKCSIGRAEFKNILMPSVINVTPYTQISEFKKYAEQVINQMLPSLAFELIKDDYMSTLYECCGGYLSRLITGLEIWRTHYKDCPTARFTIRYVFKKAFHF